MLLINSTFLPTLPYGSLEHNNIFLLHLLPDPLLIFSGVLCLQSIQHLLLPDRQQRSSNSVALSLTCIGRLFAMLLQNVANSHCCGLIRNIFQKKIRKTVHQYFAPHSYHIRKITLPASLLFHNQTGSIPPNQSRLPEWSWKASLTGIVILFNVSSNFDANPKFCIHKLRSFFGRFTPARLKTKSAFSQYVSNKDSSVSNIISKDLIDCKISVLFFPSLIQYVTLVFPTKPLSRL